jgi:hypothetical protein
MMSTAFLELVFRFLSFGSSRALPCDASIISWQRTATNGLDIKNYQLILHLRAALAYLGA